MLCAVAAKVYTKVPSELLPPDSYYLPSVEYKKDLVREFPLSAHTPGNALTAMASASAKTRQSTVDAQQSLASRVVPLANATVATAMLPANTADSPGSMFVSSVNTALPPTPAAADDAPTATAAPPANTAVSCVNMAVPPATEAADAPAITLNSSALVTNSFFNMTSISTTDFVVWPHPTPAAWKDIQTVALRAFVTLEWFGNTKVQARLDQQGKGPKSRVYQAYRLELIVLVHHLLVGHVMDPHLDMQQVVRSAVI